MSSVDLRIAFEFLLRLFYLKMNINISDIESACIKCNSLMKRTFEMQLNIENAYICDKLKMAYQRDHKPQSKTS